MRTTTRARLGAALLVGVLGVALVGSGCSEDADADAVAPAQARTAKKCSLATIKGSYAFGFQGTIQGVGPVGVSGTTTFNGSGRTTIRGFINTTTDAPAVESTMAGTYTVDPNKCTGSATYRIPPPGLFNKFTEFQFEAVIVGAGREIRYLITTPGIVIAGASVRQ